MRNRPKLVTLAVLLVGALLFSCGINQLLRPTWTLTTARGTVVNYELRYDPQTSMAVNWVEVRFQAANGNDVLFESTPEELYKPGESVPIAYYPWDPAGTAAIGREPQGMVVVVALQLVLIVACTIAGGGLLWAGWRALRRETAQPGKFRFRF